MKNNIKIRTTLLVLLVLISSSLIADEQEVSEKKVEPKTEEKAAQHVDNNIFIGVGIGYNNLNAHKSGTANLDKSIDSNGYNYAIEVGYEVLDCLDITLNYQKILNDSVSLNNYYIGTNYRFIDNKNYTPYIGVNIGQSELTWEKKPINTSQNDFSSSSYFIGATMGIIYPIVEKISLNINYQTQYMNNHTTSIETLAGNSELTHKFSHNLNVGVRYSF